MTVGPGDSISFQRVEPGYRHALRVRMALFWVPVLIGAFVLEMAIDDSLYDGLAGALAPFVALVALATVPQRIYRHLGYRIGDDHLQLVRGWMFHVDTIVPFVRVQHLDVTRGLVDKLFGTASLVVHTAGTHNSIVTVPGLSPDRAEDIRSLIARHVRTDFE